MNKLLFEVRDDKSLLLWVNDSVALSFVDLKEWRNFSDQMLGMIPEMTEHNGVEDE